jgi:hypothetical protein
MGHRRAGRDADDLVAIAGGNDDSTRGGRKLAQVIFFIGERAVV